jgi:hypothetical protein
MNRIAFASAVVDDVDEPAVWDPDSERIRNLEDLLEGGVLCSLERAEDIEVGEGTVCFWVSLSVAYYQDRSSSLLTKVT